nr:esterase-like activity of phytase family protein [uncultured Sphingomonas sp.]
MKSLNLKAFSLFLLVVASALWLRSLPQIPARPPADDMVRFSPVALPAVAGSPLRLAGAWEMSASDPRLQGLSGLSSEGQQLVAVSDMGSAVRFLPPGDADAGRARLVDLRDGPGPFGRKVYRDAEALMRDPSGRGWWVTYEQFHSIWLYDTDFHRAIRRDDLGYGGWADNRGAEGLALLGGRIAAFGENGDAILLPEPAPSRIRLDSDWMIADASNAPDGSVWLLMRHHYGAEAAIAPLIMDGGIARVGPKWTVPKGAFDNFEGMTIVRRNGGWRFWLVTDDGHRFMARTLLIALDLNRAQENARR